MSERAGIRAEGPQRIRGARAGHRCDRETVDGIWHHCAGGTGGRGNEPTGQTQLVAPVYKTKPATPGGQAKAWIKKGTGTIKVRRSFVGVTHGNHGAYTPSPATIWMSPRAQARIDKHERKHIEKAKELHDTHIKPLDDRAGFATAANLQAQSGCDTYLGIKGQASKKGKT
jgi:hypothetical protein